MHIELLNFVNSTGSSLKSFYAAVKNKMVFCHKSDGEIQVNGNLAPFVYCEIEQLKYLHPNVRLHCLIKFALSSIVELNLNAKNLHVAFSHELVNTQDFLLENEDEFNKCLSHALLSDIHVLDDITIHKINEMADNDVLIALETVLDYSGVCKFADTYGIQQIDGDSAPFPGESAVAFRFHNDPANNRFAIKLYEGSLEEQLKQAQTNLKDLIILTGPESEYWQKEWYAASHYLYKGSDSGFIECLSPDNYIGYMNLLSLPMSIVLAISVLQQPLDPKDRVLIVQHELNKVCQVIQVTRSK